MLEVCFLKLRHDKFLTSTSCLFKISYGTFDMLVFQIHRVQVDGEVEEAVPEHTANDAF